MAVEPLSFAVGVTGLSVVRAAVFRAAAAFAGAGALCAAATFVVSPRFAAGRAGAGVPRPPAFVAAALFATPAFSELFAGAFAAARPATARPVARGADLVAGLRAGCALRAAGLVTAALVVRWVVALLAAAFGRAALDALFVAPPLVTAVLVAGGIDPPLRRLPAPGTLAPGCRSP